VGAGHDAGSVCTALGRRVKRVRGVCPALAAGHRSLAGLNSSCRRKHAIGRIQRRKMWAEGSEEDAGAAYGTPLRPPGVLYAAPTTTALQLLILLPPPPPPPPAPTAASSTSLSDTAVVILRAREDTWRHAGSKLGMRCDRVLATPFSLATAWTTNL